MKKYVVVLLVLLLTVAACTSVQNNSMENDQMMEDDSMQEDHSGAMEDDAMMEQNDSMKEDSMMEKNDSMMEMTDDSMMSYSGNQLAGSTTPYLEFNQEDYEAALSENKVILLYFYASWCPICRNEQPKTFSAFNELDKENVVGFRVNYKDSNTNEYEENLAKEFGITYQHTKVILKDGERVLKAPDSWDKDRYLEEINKYA